MHGWSVTKPLSPTSSTAPPRRRSQSRPEPHRRPRVRILSRGRVVVSRLVDDDITLVDRLRQGDEAAYVELVKRYHPRLVRVATSVVGRRDVAEEVTQDTWLGVVRGIDRFEGRSSFKTWLFHILMNRAHTAAGRESRAGRPDDTVGERFDASGAWATPPVPWSDEVDDRIVADRLAPRVQELLSLLPEAQREVVILR